MFNFASKAAEQKYIDQAVSLFKIEIADTDALAGEILDRAEDEMMQGLFSQYEVPASQSKSGRAELIDLDPADFIVTLDHVVELIQQ